MSQNFLSCLQLLSTVFVVLRVLMAVLRCVLYVRASAVLVFSKSCKAVVAVRPYFSLSSLCTRSSAWTPNGSTGFAQPRMLSCLFGGCEDCIRMSLIDARSTRLACSSHVETISDVPAVCFSTLVLFKQCFLANSCSTWCSLGFSAMASHSPSLRSASATPGLSLFADAHCNSFHSMKALLGHV